LAERQKDKYRIEKALKKGGRMHILRFMGLFALIPVTLLLTLSFFVLFTLNKIQERRLKAFGLAIAVLLWSGAALVSSLGIYVVSTGRHPMIEMIKGMKRCHMSWGPGSQKCLKMKNQMPIVSLDSQRSEKVEKSGE
jgi:hypothetical protein